MGAQSRISRQAFAKANSASGPSYLSFFRFRVGVYGEVLHVSHVFRKGVKGFRLRFAKYTFLYLYSEVHGHQCCLGRLLGSVSANGHLVSNGSRVYGFCRLRRCL